MQRRKVLLVVLNLSPANLSRCPLVLVSRGLVNNTSLFTLSTPYVTLQPSITSSSFPH